MTKTELKDMAEKAISIIYPPTISKEQKESLVNMFLIGYMEGFNYVTVDAVEFEDVEKFMTMVEETQQSLFELKNEMLINEEIRKTREGI